MWITEGALVVMKGLKQKSIYLLHDSIVTGAAATTSSSDIDFDTTKLWHMRLGHMSEKGMDMLCKQGLVGSKKKREAEFLRALCLRKSPSAVIDCKTLKEFDLVVMLIIKVLVYLVVQLMLMEDHRVMEKVELEVRAPDSLPKIPIDEEDGSYSTEENEEPQEQHHNIAKNRLRREF
ncbi:hypothetical protein RJ639_039885 [Escallonia herrerae]|uniref:GAG-pre-integrase domain-containing protein n=1 Tax=Escallonia herrerae TaxID=1293975 RepID=A0AA88WLV7_9ASTE|nr:hypothetical protein RJ639_039885 [Escallonia herrerae]